jgi:pimeloyl-ACP methyl ester carboxylesterase
MPVFRSDRHPEIGINYSQMGQGEPCLLIHGMATNLGFWHVGLLNRLSAHVRLTLYDLRGHGRSTMPATGYRPADMAGDLLELMDHLAIPSAHLVGHSFGGEVALEYGAAHPDRVRSLTLADSRIRPLQPRHNLRSLPGFDRILAQLNQLGVTIDPDEDGAGLLLLEAAARPEVREAIGRLADRSFLPFQGEFAGSRASRQWRRLLEQTSARDDLRRGVSLAKADLQHWRIPTLAVYGERSQCRPTFDALREIIPHLHAVLIPDGDHFFPARRPDLLAQLLIDFLAGTRDGGVASELPNPAPSAATPQPKE